MAAPAEGMLATSGRGPPWARPYRGRGGECVLMETGSHPEVSGMFLGPEVSKPPSAKGKTDQTPSTTAWSQQRCKGSGRSKGTARGWEHPGAGTACQGRVTLPILPVPPNQARFSRSPARAVALNRFLSRTSPCPTDTQRSGRKDFCLLLS